MKVTVKTIYAYHTHRRIRLIIAWTSVSTTNASAPTWTITIWWHIGTWARCWPTTAAF